MRYNWILFLSFCVSLELFEQGEHGALEINTDFLPHNLPIRMESISFINPHKLRMEFSCMKDCDKVLETYRFFAELENDEGEILLQTSYKGNCFGPHVSAQQNLYEPLKLEFPLNRIGATGLEHSFINTQRILYKRKTLPNEDDTALEELPFGNSVLEISAPDRNLLGQMTITEKRTFQCIEEPPKTLLFDLSQCSEAPPKFVGKISLLNNRMVNFEGVDLERSEKKASLRNYINDLQILFVGVTKGGRDVRESALTAKSHILRYSGEPINGPHFLPRSLSIETLRGVVLMTERKEVCSISLNEETAKTASESVAHVHAVSPENNFIYAMKECPTLKNVLEGEISLSNEYLAGSVATLKCNDGFLLSPSDYTDECQNSFGVLQWKNQGVTPECVKIEKTCRENYCKYGGDCVIEGHRSRCVCADPFYGNFCELVREKTEIVTSEQSCKENCFNGDCVKDMKLGSFVCVCEKNLLGQKCDISLFSICGSFATNVTFPETGGFQCICIKEFSALPNSRCVENASTETRCILFPIPHGNYMTEVLFILPGEKVEVFCENDFSQPVVLVRCKPDGKMTTPPDKLCRAEGVTARAEKVKTEVWTNLVISIGSFIVILVLAWLMFRYVIKDA